VHFYLMAKDMPKLNSQSESIIAQKADNLHRWLHDLDTCQMKIQLGVLFLPIARLHPVLECTYQKDTLKYCMYGRRTSSFVSAQKMLMKTKQPVFIVLITSSGT
jgi:hypothetical protein